MASRSHGSALRQIHHLFEWGSASGLSEWQLLDRYASRRDESAFEALVARHGPMVLGVCRRVLDDPHAVDDAFQATFLVLVRKARSLGQRDAIGHWLYGVACRVALRARCETARRRSKEVSLARVDREAVVQGDEPACNELAPALDQELSRLPLKYRAPVVLCYLEGLTHEEAARQLHWPVGSVKGRLARARDLLRGRLARRGLMPAAAVVGTALSREAAAAVPPALLQATVRAAVQIISGRAAATVVSASIVRLAEGVLSTMFLTKLKVTAAVLGVCGSLALGCWGLAQVPGQGRLPDATRGATKPSMDHTPPAKKAALASREATLRDKLDRPLPRPLRLEGASLEHLLKSIKQATQAPGDTGVPIYVEPEGLKEAGATIDSPISFDAREDLPLKEALDLALRPLKLAATIQNRLLVITSRQEVMFIEVRALNEQLRGMTGQAPTAHGVAATEGLSPAAWLKRIQGHQTVFTAKDDEPDPEDEARTRAVLDALKKRVPMAFNAQTPLEDVIKYIKKETTCPMLPDGIPIYIDPVSLEETEKTMTSPVEINLHGVTLRESLRLALGQLGLTYIVKGGLLSIVTDSEENEAPSPILQLEEKAVRGELSLAEMNDLIELFTLRNMVRSFGPPRDGDRFQ
jgi:RNA polymerase sigma factor (sigma-70 family)